MRAAGAVIGERHRHTREHPFRIECQLLAIGNSTVTVQPFPSVVLYCDMPPVRLGDRAADGQSQACSIDRPAASTDQRDRSDQRPEAGRHPESRSPNPTRRHVHFRLINCWIRRSVHRLGVYLMALSMRLKKSWRSRSGSPYTEHAGRSGTSSTNPFSFATTCMWFGHVEHDLIKPHERGRCQWQPGILAAEEK